MTRWLVVLLILGIFGFGVNTAFLVDSTLEDFINGEFDGVAISSDGSISLAPYIKEFLSYKNMFVWDALKYKGELYFVMGLPGNVIKINQDGKKELLYSGKDDNISAIAVFNSKLVVAVSDNNNSFIMVMDGKKFKKRETFKEKYIWNIHPFKDKMYIITGKKACIYSIDKEWNKHLIYKATNEKHILSITDNKDNKLFFSSSGNGIIYSYNIKNKVLSSIYSANEGEISSLTYNNGKLYFCSGNMESVEDSLFNYRNDFNDKKNTKDNKVKPKNSVYVLNISSFDIKKLFTMRAVFTSMSYGKIGSTQGIYITTDDGRIFFLSDNKKIIKCFEIKKGNALKTKLIGKTQYILCGNPARVYRVFNYYRREGRFISDVLINDIRSHIGNIKIEGNPNGGKIEVLIRSGNTPKPDISWSKFVKDIRLLKPSKYLQYMIKLTSDNKKRSPIVKEVSIAYLPMNISPVITSIRFGRPIKKKKSKNNMQFFMRKLSWDAYDPNGDRLKYTIYFRAKGESKWKLFQDYYYSTSIKFDIRILDDGEYEFKVVASDIPDNTPSTAKQTEYTSKYFFIDSHPPQISIDRPIVKDKYIIINGKATDNMPIVGLEYSLNASDWKVFLPSDGIADSKIEPFVIKIATSNTNLNIGENQILIKARDKEGNMGTSRINFYYKAK